MEKYRGTGRSFWASGEILLGYREDKLGVRDRDDIESADHRPDPEDLQARSAHGQRCHRRHRELYGFQVAAELDDQQAGTVQGAEEGRGLHLGVQSLHGCGGRLCEEAHERVHRGGDHAGVAVSPGDPCGGYPCARAG